MSNKAKKKYFGGVIDSADETQLLRKETGRKREALPSHFEGGDSAVQIDNGTVRSVLCICSRLLSRVNTYITVRQIKINDIGDSPGREFPSTSIDVGETHTDGKKLSLTRRTVNDSAGPVWFQDYSEFLFHCR